MCATGSASRPMHRESLADPLWMAQVDWPAIIHDLGLGHPLKFLWEERAQQLITYPNFWKQFYRKFPQYRAASVTAREFEPGERVEVDYAGDPIEWIEIKTGEIRKGMGLCRRPRLQPAAVRLGSRGYEEPQLACSHRRMYRLLRWRAARDGPRLLEARRAQVPPVRSGPEPRLCASWPLITPPRWCRRVLIIPKTKLSSKGWSKS